MKFVYRHVCADQQSLFSEGDLSLCVV